MSAIESITLSEGLTIYAQRDASLRAVEYTVISKTRDGGEVGFKFVRSDSGKFLYTSDEPQDLKDGIDIA